MVPELAEQVSVVEETVSGDPPEPPVGAAGGTIGSSMKGQKVVSAVSS